MTTFKLKFRPSTVPGRPGTLYWLICRKQSSKRINTDIHLLPSQWERMAGVPCTDLDRDGLLIRDIIHELDAAHEDYTPDDVARKFLAKKNSGAYLLPYVKHDIDLMLENKRFGTARNRQKTLNSLMDFLGGRDILLSDLDSKLISEYNAWLHRRNVSRNTISFYMRSLRSAYNKAVNEGLTLQTYPFKDVYTGVDRTRKRAVSEDILIRMSRLDLNGSKALELTRDMFVFSYCTRGMSFVDMAMLRKRDVHGEFIFYTRRKTGQRMSVRIEPCTRSIIKKYSEHNRNQIYLFPILDSEESRKAYVQYQTALGYYNRQLKKLGSMLGLDIPLSSYVARHTWATAARDHNIPIAVISSGMGHTTESTTRIYLNSLDGAVVDKANRIIVGPLNTMAGESFR